MTSTTLMTFLLCTNPQVRSVKLLGSWDNFSKPYFMERDKRVGPGHWRGCHTFTNIICDGFPNNMVPARSGGLKMGCTYWYYYLLDDDIEYYNTSEPVTTHCPFLPGQPVNVLQVPIILPDTAPTHSPARSPSARRIEQTMNPEDKYMNPRQPPKPKLRLRTSPPLLQQPTLNWSFSTSSLGAITNKASSQPIQGASKVKCARNENEKPARSVSPPRSRGLRAAFRQWNASSPNLSPAVDQNGRMARLVPDCDPRYGRYQVSDERLHIRSHSNDSYARSPSAVHMAEYGEKGSLPLRRPVSAGAHESISLSIQERRALNSKSPDLSTPRNHLTLRKRHELAATDNASSEANLVPTARRSISTRSSPSMAARSFLHPSTPEDAETPTPFAVMNKRLPTLPNSPSSVMDEALRDLDARERELDMENLASHFSDFTETESVAGDSVCERSRFSEWSTDTELISPESMTSSSTFNEKQDSPMPRAMESPELPNPSNPNESSGPGTPHLTVDSKSSPATVPGDSPHFNLPLPRLTVTLSPSDLNIPGLCIDEDGEELESNPKRHAAFFGAIESLKGLGLSSPDASALRNPEGIQGSMDAGRSLASTDDPKRYSTATLLGQSATMQEMLDELSYLKNLIQSGGSPDL